MENVSGTYFYIRQIGPLVFLKDRSTKDLYKFGVGVGSWGNKTSPPLPQSLGCFLLFSPISGHRSGCEELIRHQESSLPMEEAKLSQREVQFHLEEIPEKRNNSV